MGALATAVDLLALALLVEVLGVPPAVANVPALLAGAAVQFFGCRHLVFGSGEGSLARHLGGFLLAEMGALILNAIIFHVLIRVTPLPYAFARVGGQAVVYAAFSYPMWSRVFRADVTAPRPDVVDP